MGICGTTSAAFLLPVLGSKQNLYWTLGLFFHKDHEETLSLLEAWMFRSQQSRDQGDIKHT
jgi:hypothetical protein